MTGNITDYGELVTQASSFMRLAVPLMNKHGVPPTPKNYSVWYEHVSGTNAKLSNTLQSMVSESLTLSEVQCETLYEKFFDPQTQRSDLTKMRQELIVVMKDVIGFVSSSVVQAGRTNDALTDILNRIDHNMSASELQAVINDVLSETRQAINSGELLSERLNSVMVEVQSLKQELDDTRREVKTDSLTTLANRRAFDEQLIELAEEADEVALAGMDMCLILADIDLFKNINDTHGHMVGDQVLRIVANVMKNAVKPRDLVARYGGEEFAILLQDTNLQNAMTLAERIRKEIAAKRIKRKDTGESLGEITLSFGVSSYEAGEGVESYMQRTDRALYLSKRKGRNYVSEAQPPII